MLTVKILGSGCANCKNVESVARKAISDLAIEAEVTKVTDFKDIMAYNIMSTPGLVINEKLVCAGRVPSRAEVTTFMTNALMAK
jgi:small redox-active disulfide protein 2